MKLGGRGRAEMLRKFLGFDENDFKNVKGRIAALEAEVESRISALEAEVARLKLAETVVTPQQVDAALRQLGERIKDGKPNYSYFNIRFRSIEVALANINALAACRT